MKKLVSLILCIALLGLSGFNALAAGETFSYTTNSDGSITITGVSNAVSGALDLPAEIDGSAVTAIGSGAFQNSSNLTEVVIPEGITEIKSSTFAGCAKLTKVTAANTLKKVGELAFSQCVKLESITMNGTESIGRNAFLGTAWYNNSESKAPVYLGNVLYKYKGSAPSGTTVTVKEGTVSISDNAFDTSLGLAAVELPESLKHIGSSAFINCRSLETVSAKGGIQSVGAMAFSGTAWYENKPEGVVYLGTVAIGFKSGESAGTSITVADGTTSIADYAFSGLTGISEVILPDTVEYIGREAFYDCTALSQVNIPKSLTEIGELAFGYYGGEQVARLIGFMFDDTTTPAAVSYAAKHKIPIGGEYNMGDVNLDGRVNVGDAVVIARFSASLNLIVGKSLIYGDMNQSNKLEISDAVAIARISAGLA